MKRIFRKAKIVYLALTSVVLTLAGVGTALAATTTSTVESDYSQAVTEGQAQIHNDPAAAANQNEVKDGERVEGDVDNGQVEVQEQVDPQEKTEQVESTDAQNGGDSSKVNSGGSDSSSSKPIIDTSNSNGDNN